MPPLVLDDEEAVAIAVGLRAAAGASIDGIEDTSLRALAKLEQLLPDRLRRRVNAVHSNVVPLRWSGTDGPTVDPEVLAVLALGCRDHEQLRFEYQRRDGEATRRLVEPHQLVSAGRRWYLVAWDVRRDDWRTFRVDRLTGPQLAGVRFQSRPLPAVDAAEFVARSITAMPLPYEATVVVHGPVDDVAKVVRWADAEVEIIDERTCRARIRAESLEWLVSIVAMIAVDFDIEVNEPPAAVARIRELTQRLGRGTAAATQTQSKPEEPKYSR
jgi:predicted DNA-binding transcriptional regulator YafY